MTGQSASASPVVHGGKDKPAAELVRATFTSPPVVRKPKRRGPIYVDGVRLGRLALWS